MKAQKQVYWVVLGIFIGALLVGYWTYTPKQAQAGTSDRHEDYVMCTGSVAMSPKSNTDGVWLLDYRAGKLLGTVIDRNRGKIVGWAEVDLVTEFGVPPRGDVHFLMASGQISNNQAALYVAETTSGRFGVYSMGPRPDGQGGIMIHRHDMVMFRQAGKKE